MYWLEWHFTQVLQRHFTQLTKKCCRSCTTKGCRLAIRITWISHMKSKTITSSNAVGRSEGTVRLGRQLVGCSMHVMPPSETHGVWVTTDGWMEQAAWMWRQNWIKGKVSAIQPANYLYQSTKVLFWNWWRKTGKLDNLVSPGKQKWWGNQPNPGITP